jgi:Fe-S-cluster containining protein
MPQAHELQPTDRLQLTCTRLGTCCHGHQIFVCPWEVARLAHGLGLGLAEFRDRYTDCGGTRLIFDGAALEHGPDSHRGKAACALYDPANGCSAHRHRPLVCRLYPLGRQRREGRTIYHQIGERLPCFELCPTVVELPQLSVGDYLASQDTTAAEAAHDAYASLAYGMVRAALVITRHVDAAEAAALPAFFAGLRQLTAAERPGRIPGPWLDRLTLAPAGIALDDPLAFVNGHGQALALALQNEFGAATAPDALIQAARLYLVLALHLGATVGTDATVMARLLAGEEVQG